MFSDWGHPGKLRVRRASGRPHCGFMENPMPFCNLNPRHPAIPESVGGKQVTQAAAGRCLQPHSLYYYY